MGWRIQGVLLPRMFQMSKQKTCLFNISTFSKPFQWADGIQESKGRRRRGEGRERNISWKVAQGRNKFMTSTFTPFLIYLRYKNSVIWPVCFPNKHFYLQQIKSRPTSRGTGTSQSPSGDHEHRPDPKWSPSTSMKPSQINISPLLKDVSHRFFW